METCAELSWEQMKCSYHRSRRVHFQKKAVITCYELSEPWAVCRQKRAVCPALHQTRKHTAFRALAHSESSEIGVQIPVRILKFNASRKNRTPVFSSFTAVGCTPLWHWKKEWSDPSLAQLRVLFVADVLSPQGHIPTLASKSDQLPSNIELSAQSRRPNDV